MGTRYATWLLCKGNFLSYNCSLDSHLVDGTDIWTIPSQSDRTKNVGVVDSEYIVHLGLPTLGVSDGDNVSDPLFT